MTNRDRTTQNSGSLGRIYNRPGLTSLGYRIGTYGSIFQAMKQRLASLSFTGPDTNAESLHRPRFPLGGLTTRDGSDPTIAILDAWAVLEDVLTFYQERIANEGFLRTAIEEQSLEEMARLVGYRWKPGVAASVFLAYTVQDVGGNPDVTIPASARVQSLPLSGGLPQTYETSDPLLAKASWSLLPVRTTRPQSISQETDTIYFKGVATNLKANDPLLLVQGGQPLQGKDEKAVIMRVASVEPQFVASRTKVTLQKTGTIKAEIKQEAQTKAQRPVSPLENTALLRRLGSPPARHPVDAAQLVQDLKMNLDPMSEAAPRLLARLRPDLGLSLFNALGGLALPSNTAPVEVHAFRARAAPFGHNAPLAPVLDKQGKIIGHREWTLERAVDGKVENITIVVDLQSSLGVWFNADTTPTLKIKIAIGDNLGSIVFVLNGIGVSQSVDYELARESIEATLVGPENNEDVRKLELHFVKRNISIVVVFNPNLVSVVPDVLRRAQLTLDPASLVDSVEIININGTIRSLFSSSPAESADTVSLDSTYDQIMPGSWVLITRTDAGSTVKLPIVSQIVEVENRSRPDYGLSGKTTSLKLEADKPWLDVKNDRTRFATVIRGTTVYAQSERLDLAEAPITEDVSGDLVVLDGVHGGLEPGRWLIVSGERTDIPDVKGVVGTELVMLAASSHVEGGTRPTVANTADAGDKICTLLKFSSPLSYAYKRESVLIYGNVVHATHGDTKFEVLGSGDSNLGSRQFTLRLYPIAQISAPTASGVRSTLEVRVDGLLWREVESLSQLGPDDRAYMIRTSNDSRTTVVFGDGTNGARPPAGIENITASYRVGAGGAGNAKNDQISLVGDKPLGVKSVTNPLPATGGANRESSHRARSNIPYAVVSLDRVVSVQDYADFARTFAGVGKAIARRIVNGRSETIHVTIAGATDGSIGDSDDVCNNLRSALLNLGDPYLPVVVEACEPLLVVIKAKVGISRDSQWKLVESAVRKTLLDRLGFDQRNLGQDVTLSEVISVIQSVPSVVYVDIDVLASVGVSTLFNDLRRLSLESPGQPPDRICARLAELKRDEQGALSGFAPAQLVFLSGEIGSTVVLNEVAI